MSGEVFWLERALEESEVAIAEFAFGGDRVVEVTHPEGVYHPLLDVGSAVD